MPKPKKAEPKPKKVETHFKGEEVGPGPHKVEEPPKDNVALLESIIKPAYEKARAEGSYAVGIFHRDYGDRIKEWKDLTGKKFPEEF